MMKLNKLLLGVAAVCAIASSVYAQSSPGLSYGQVPTAGQWNGYFASKQDVLGYTPLNQAGGTMLGPLKTAAPTISTAGFSILQGVAPNSPNNGDIWLTSTGLYYQAGNITFGPIGAGTITGPATTTVGNVAKWGNTSGTSLVDGGPLGTAATQNTGTSGHNLPFLDGANTWGAAQTFSVPLAASSGGTGVTSSTGTGSVVLSNSPTLVTPALGTPASGTLTNATGLPISTGVSGLGTGVATFLAAPSSANLASALTDETGTGAAVFANSPLLVTPNVGVATATSINGATIGVGQYQGTATNNNATAGNIGEYISSNIPAGSAVTLTPSNTDTNITSVSLTAGDWTCAGSVAYVIGSSSVTTGLLGWISSTSATRPTAPGGGAYFVQSINYVANTTNIYPVGSIRLSLSATTTIYLSAAAVWSTAAPTAYGFIGCRRQR